MGISPDRLSSFMVSLIFWFIGVAPYDNDNEDADNERSNRCSDRCTSNSPFIANLSINSEGGAN